MDRNSAIGLTLIAVMLLAYFYWFSSSPTPAEPAPVTESVQAPVDSTTTNEAPVVADSVLAQQYGDAATLMKGTEAVEAIETEDVKISFSSKGGVIKELELKHFKTYAKKPEDRKPLKLIQPQYNSFKLNTTFNGQPLDLYALFYEVQKTTQSDSIILTFTANLGSGQTFVQRYAVPLSGYEIGYKLTGTGLDQALAGDQLMLQWQHFMVNTEKDMKETRVQSTINYYTEEDGFDDLAARSNDTEREVLSTPTQWVSIKQKFFLAAIVARNDFSGGEIETSTNLADTVVAKRAMVKLQIPKSQITSGKANFAFYIGPNDYQVIGDVADKFAKNVYLGWPPVYWVNKFVIFPVFHFLTKFIGNYGVIIIILVILLKLVLAPLSYRSYLSMAKMRVLKPDLDEIKERVGDDMTKVQQEQMKLYQQVGVNPISGCVPVLLQMPILFAMFYLFPASIELRQQPLLWAEDLSTYDSLIQLPFTIPFGVGDHISLFTLLMTISTLIYTWQNNQLSSVQGPMKSMSYIMPLIFFFVLNSFSAGLTFYYFISNLVTFSQQAIIKRFVDEDKIRKILDENRKKNAAGGGKKSKFMARLEEAMKASEEARKKGEAPRKKK